MKGSETEPTPASCAQDAGVFANRGKAAPRGGSVLGVLGKGRFGPLGRPGAVQQPARFPHGVGAVVFQAAGCLFNPAAARSGERNHGFAGKILAFQEGIHNAGFHIPPDRKTQQHGIILRQVHSRRRQGRAAGRVAHFPGTAALAVAPVQVGRGIGGRRADFIQVCPDGLRQRSVWFVTLAVYYLFLAVMRFSLVRCTRRAGADLPGEYRRYRFCGVLLVLMNAALAGVVVLVLHRGGGFRYSGFMIYAMAAYAFYATIAGVVNLVRYRRYNSPVLTASRAVSLAAALPLYNRVTRRERQKLAPLVRELTREPGSPQAGC